MVVTTYLEVCSILIVFQKTGFIIVCRFGPASVNRGKVIVITIRFVKGLIGLIVFAAAIGALITQLQIRKKIPPVFRAENAVLLNRHRRLGRIALGGFILNSVICLLIGFYPVMLTDARHLSHSILAFFCTVLFLGKVWITRRKIRAGIKRIIPIGIVVFALNLGIFATATIFGVFTYLTSL